MDNGQIVSITVLDDVQTVANVNEKRTSKNGVGKGSPTLWDLFVHFKQPDCEIKLAFSIEDVHNLETGLPTKESETKSFKINQVAGLFVLLYVSKAFCGNINYEDVRQAVKRILDKKKSPAEAHIFGQRLHFDDDEEAVIMEAFAVPMDSTEGYALAKAALAGAERAVCQALAAKQLADEALASCFARIQIAPANAIFAPATAAIGAVATAYQVASSTVDIAKVPVASSTAAIGAVATAYPVASSTVDIAKVPVASSTEQSLFASPKRRKSNKIKPDNYEFDGFSITSFLDDTFDY